METPRTGDARKLWKTQDSTALPFLRAAGNGDGSGEASKCLAHSKTPRLGTDGTRELIPRKGDMARNLRTHDARMHSYVGALVGGAVIVGGLLWLTGYRLGSPWAVAALAAIALFSERGTVRLGKTTEQSISLLPTLFGAVLYGPLAGAIIGGSSMLGDSELYGKGEPGRQPRLKWATYTSTRFIAGGAIGLAAQGVSAIVPDGFGEIIVATLVGAAVGEVLDIASAALTAHVRRVRSMREVVRTHLPLVLASAPLYAPVVAVLIVAYEVISPWTAPLFFVPAVAAQRLFAMYQQQRRLADDLSVANEHLARANLSFAGALITTLDARDRYTAGHSAAVAIYSRDIAARMGLNDEQQERAYLCGLVHDIGKIGLPAGLLEKAGPLTLEERRQMQEHPIIGERILGKVDDYSEIARIVRHHHERVDGNGYPDGLRDDDVPLLSRIIAVADAYNAMTSDRPYRDAMPSRVARMRLAQAVESQFDTAVVAAFEAVLVGADEPYRSGARREFDIFSVETASPPAAATAVA